MPAKKKGHPLDSLTFTAPKLDEVKPTPASEVELVPQDGMQPTPAAEAEMPKGEGTKPAPAEVETRASNVILPVTVWDWIDAKHAEARRGGGKAIRKTAIIRAVFELAMALEFDLTGSQSEAEIRERMIGASPQLYK
jgi:hypothetical protein